MSERKLAWLDPFFDSAISSTKGKFPYLFSYLELLTDYFFKIVTIIVIARVYHLRDQGETEIIDSFYQRIAPDMFGLIDELAPSNNPANLPTEEVRTVTKQCLQIQPLSDEAIWGLRQVEEIEQKNLYRRITDTIEVLQDTQLLLLALAFEDDRYEDFFDLQRPDAD